nr:hypothetical protein [Crucivirus sp.]
MSRQKPSLLDLLDESPEEVAVRKQLLEAKRRSELSSRSPDEILRQSRDALTQQYPLLESLHTPATQEDINRANGLKPNLQAGESKAQFDQAMIRYESNRKRSEQPTTQEIVYSMHTLSAIQRAGGAAVDVTGGTGANPNSVQANVRRFK